MFLWTLDECILRGVIWKLSSENCGTFHGGGQALSVPFKTKCLSVCLSARHVSLSVTSVLKLGKEFSWFSNHFVTLKFNGAQKCAFRTWVLLRAQLVWSFFQRRQIVRERAHKNAQRCALFGNSFCCMPTFFPILHFCRFFACFTTFLPKVHWNFMLCSWDIQNYGDVHKVCGGRHQFVVGNSFCCVHMFSNHCGVFSPFLHLFALLIKLH